jgi:undecaprenyl-diphosphatase
MTPTAARPRWRTWVRRLGVSAGALLGAIVLAAGGIYGVVQSGGNLHPVEAGVVYRSAQLSGDSLDHVFREYGIRSVLNLRGNNAGKSWYDDEIRTARGDGLVHFDYALSAEHDVSPAQMAELVRLVSNAPKPLLIHCNAGADRTGLVSALYELSRGAPAAQAGAQLSLRYGHFPWLWSRTGAMDRSLALYLAHAPASQPTP